MRWIVWEQDNKKHDYNLAMSYSSCEVRNNYTTVPNNLK